MRKLNDWVDFMEGELLPKDMERLSLLLKHSLADQLILDNLRRLRRMIKKSDRAQQEINTLNQPEFLSQFHERVMKGVVELSAHKGENEKKSVYTTGDFTAATNPEL